MTDHFHRRHSRWYEVILFNFWFQLIVGAFFIVLLPHAIRWESLLFSQAKWSSVQINTLIANGVAFFIAFLVLKKMQQFPGSRSMSYLFPTIATSWLIVIAILLFMREEYARSVLFISFLLANFWAFLGFFIGRKYYKPKLAIVPFGRALELADTQQAVITILDSPDLGKRRYDAIVADLHSTMLDEWQRFLSECTLSHIPVFHTTQLTENLTGRVQLDHLSENIFGHLQPSLFYIGAKRLFDTLVALVFLPLLLPVFLITAILIKLDSKGPVFYNQERIGYRNKIFKMYKFRSMKTDLEGRGFTEGEDDPRITRVGKIIRKYRIDELPQFLNVLKGDMSFIGPRPESLTLSKWYEKDVPFFNYRHIVRPGISGWAQVTQGYAAEVDGMKIKLQYDFYYIKHFSLWLDILIVFKTIRTMLTGFGAR